MKTASLRSAIVLAALLGLLVSIFAAAEFYEASLRSVCSLSSFFSCSLVDQSGKTSTLGIPDYLWGIGGFILILILAGIADRRPRDVRAGYALLLFTTLGIVLSLYFLYVELVEIDALCLVCVGAYLLGGVAWIGSIALVRRLRAGEPAEPRERPGSDAA